MRQCLACLENAQAMQVECRFGLDDAAPEVVVCAVLNAVAPELEKLGCFDVPVGEIMLVFLGRPGKRLGA